MKRAQRRIAEGILFTDMYQLTMAQMFYRHGIHEKTVQFDHFYRANPDYGKHEAGFCINAGLEWLLDWMKDARFREKDIQYLRKHKARQSGKSLFKEDFLQYLLEYGNFDNITLRAIPEGRVVHPNVPLTTVQGPFAMAQILESPLLNFLNYQTLIATKAARIHVAGKGRPLLEFGMRRAQGLGSLAGTRAALIGGADFSSNTGISYALGNPPSGTHAHCMVQAFMALGHDELDAFRAYADVYPDDCLLLVDTINTLESGLPNAIKVFEELRRKGHEPVGIRLDSGDLAYLAIQSAKMLNKAGFEDAVIVLSNALDELVIWQIVTQIREEASQNDVDPDKLINRLVYGVGTGLITSEGASALDGVYKLVSIEKNGELFPAMKLSGAKEKILNPGNKKIWRIYDVRGKATADLIAMYDEDLRNRDQITLHHLIEHTKKRTLLRNEISELEELHIDILKDGKLVYELPTLEQIRKTRIKDIDSLDPGVKRFVNPHFYHVSLSKKLWDTKEQLVEKLKA